MDVITEEMVEAVHLGSVFLGSGGGESSNYLLSILKTQLGRKKGVKLLKPGDLSQVGSYISVGMIGTQSTADYPTGEDGIKTIMELVGKETEFPDALFTIEAAGVNILYPILVSSLMDLPFIDGDTMGRAFPEFQMTTIQIAGLSVAPIVISDRMGNFYKFKEKDNFNFEAKARKIVTEHGHHAYFAGFKSNGSILRKILIPQTISFARDIGQVFTKGRSYKEILDNLIYISKNSLYGAAIEIFRGTVRNIEQTKEVNWKTINIKGTGEYRDSFLDLLIQNENHIAYRDRKIAAMVPDIITIVNMDSLKPIPNDVLNPAMDISVIGLPAPLILRTKEALNIIGPKCFGYKSNYESLEELYYSYYY